MLYTFLIHEQSVQWFAQHTYVCNVYTLLQGILQTLVVASG